MKFAPIALFVYNRPDHTEQALEALNKNIFADQSVLYVFADGPKPDATIEDLEKIKRTRAILKKKQWCSKVIIKENQLNKGLAKSIISGVSEVLNAFDSIIVLEDDIVAGEGFLKYMNEALTLYKNEKQVGCIHAWNYDMDMTGYNHSTFFLKGADCWGWATWKQAWEYFNPDGSFLLKYIKENKLEYEFNRKGTHDFVNMLKNQISGKNNSWAIRWHASLFINNMFCLHPVKPIVKNIGLDNSGTHCAALELEQEPLSYIDINKIKIAENELFFQVYRKSIVKDATNKTFDKIKNVLYAFKKKAGL